MERQHHVQEEKAEKGHQAEQSQDQQAGKRAEKTEEEAQEALIQPVNGPLSNGPFADKTQVRLTLPPPPTLIRASPQPQCTIYPYHNLRELGVHAPYRSSTLYQPCSL